MISTFGSVVLIDVTGRTASVLERFTDGEAETQTQQQLEGIQQSVYLYHTTLLLLGSSRLSFTDLRFYVPLNTK